MNSLSWMIYAAEIFGRASALGVAASIVSAICFGVSVIATGLAVMDGTMTLETAAKWRRLPVIVMAIAIPLAVLSPSSTTVYMMAASEAGETIIKSPESKEVFDDLKSIIKSKLKEQLPKP